jgi:hypothetical protein
MEQLLGLVGGQLKILVALAVMSLGVFRWLIGRRDLYFVRRKEILQYWKNPHELDALSVEVLTRQLFGAYLPADLVRRVCSRSGVEVCRTLGDLADIWSLVEWHPKSRQIRWKAKAGTAAKRARWNLAFWAAYFVAAFCGLMILFRVAAASSDATITTSIAAFLCGVMLIGAAWAALWRIDAWSAASRLGDDFLETINQVAVSRPQLPHHE